MNEVFPSYPLYWPPGWARSTNRVRSQFDRNRTMARARDILMAEVRRMGGRNLIVSSNLTLRNDGIPRSSQRQPDDSGVAVYFDYQGKAMCLACDKYFAVEDNLWAIALTIECLRSIERHGSSDLLERAFRGFAQLPPPLARPWYEVLQVGPRATMEEKRAAYLTLAKKLHPDAGGSVDQAMQEPA